MHGLLGAAAATQWVRIDRLDGLDQSVDNFPYWVKKSWGWGSIPVCRAVADDCTSCE